MKKLITLLSDKKFTFFILVAVLNFILICFVYRSAFSLQLEGDTWQYAWTYRIAFGNSLFTPDTMRALKTSLGGSTLAFALVSNTFGLSGTAYYTVSVILKFLTVLAFYWLAYKLTRNKFASFVSSLLLSATFVGIEATHWVFNMYGYIGLIFIILGLTTALDLPEKFNFKKWFFSFVLIAVGIWFGPMRTTGIILVVLAWCLYKIVNLRTKESVKNFLIWLGAFSILYFAYKRYLGLFEQDYSIYIWNTWWDAFNQYLKIGKYDFLLSPVTSIGRLILPDAWVYSTDFFKIFSPMFGLTNIRAIGVPMFIVYLIFSLGLSTLVSQKRKVFLTSIFLLGIIWSILVFIVYKAGPVNFPAYQDLMLTLWGGYFLSWCLSFVIVLKSKDNFLKDTFFIAFMWSFSFILVPLALNRGNVFGTLHRYYVISAATMPLFIAGTLTLVFKGGRNLIKVIILALVFFMIIINGYYTKQFFDTKALAHSYPVSTRVWSEFSQIVNNPVHMAKSPTIWFEVKDAKDGDILLESILFGLSFKAGIYYGWDPHTMSLYYQNYPSLKADVKKNPKILDEFYAIRVRDGSLVNITNEIKKDLKNKI